MTPIAYCTGAPGIGDGSSGLASRSSLVATSATCVATDEARAASLAIKALSHSGNASLARSVEARRHLLRVQQINAEGEARTHKFEPQSMQQAESAGGGREKE